ncbi:hypothetical protein NP493_67g05031 [Ridgeia piscesae]|uniref:Uncharacterized protein n=1 Tax=Ridgeia piscesae TaxID=27915 RepID=A0AAD9P9S3_RIDPI|nr:hypothetical protein NP493_67g05031 [Ridgeia piscesae]
MTSISRGKQMRNLLCYWFQSSGGVSSPTDNVQWWVNIGLNQDGFEYKPLSKIRGDGGVFATKHIHRGEFIPQYVGEHITGMEARRREKEYQKGRRCYMCLYDHNDQEYG